ncbi:MAG TPA: 6-carboxytetrahydropterin synthase [Phycisphaerae bacterium]|nr:6-carboxytetrahydropterin synthase [Phycisphaerae bacterium]
MIYAIEVNTEFYAAHQLRLSDGSFEPLHGHLWRVEVRVVSEKLDAIQTVMDFHLLESLLKTIIAPWPNKRLNDFAPFDKEWSPSAERVAEHIAKLLIFQIPAPAQLSHVRVGEAPGCYAIFSLDR